jgi:hypothetical protein
MGGIYPMTKIIRFPPDRKKMREIIKLLKDRSLVIQAIEEGVCLICGRKTSLFREMGFITAYTSGLCPTCYRGLSVEEKLVANYEASHKQIIIKVMDDRDTEKNQD